MWYHFILVWNYELILCGEATEAHQLPLVFSVSLIDVDAEVYDSSVSEVKTVVGFSFDLKTEGSSQLSESELLLPWSI